MKNTLVMKFGGTSLMTAERIRNAAKIVAASAAAGKQVIVVVSAMGHTTDELLRLSGEVTAMPNSRELDALMATGEQVSATLMTMALQAIGYKARSLNGAQARIITDSCFGNAKIKVLDPRLLVNLMGRGIVPVVAGFQGMTVTGETSTLGRGGSDTTAIAIAAAVQAERCDIYTDVDGVYSADPRIVKNAIRLEAVSISEMLELASSGAQVLNARSVELARDKHVAVRVRSSFQPADEGTLVAAAVPENRDFTGIAVNKDIGCVEIHLEKLELGLDRRLSSFRALRSKTKRDLLKQLSGAGVEAEIVNSMRPNPFRIRLILKTGDILPALTVLHNAAYPIKDIGVSVDIAAVSLVAGKITAKHYIEALKAMVQHDIRLVSRVWNCQRLTLVAPLSQAEQAADALHSHFAGIKLAA